MLKPPFAVVLGLVCATAILPPAHADDAICGPAPSLPTTANSSESLKGQLQGQAEFLSRLVGKAELGGQVEAARTSIYQTSDSFFAAQKDAYLAYMFCVIVLSDKTLSTQDKLDAINKFKQPVGVEKAKADAERKSKLDRLTHFLDDAAAIKDDFIRTDNLTEIKAKYTSWFNAAYAELSQNFDPSYAAQFRSAHDTAGIYPTNHSIEGDAIYADMTAKMAIINKAIDDVRSGP
jgi:hypothetical protein